MKENIKRWHIVGLVFIIVVGSLLHFVYEWSGEKSFIGIIGAVNESTWEHLKLLFWPALIFSFVEYIYIGHKFDNYITAKAISFFVGILSIITLFYTYTGAIGNNFIVIDILIFVLSAVIAQYVSYRIITNKSSIDSWVNIIAIIFIILLMFSFVAFTFNPPQIPLFEDPLTKSYGI